MYDGMVQVDGCSWTFDGYTEKLAASKITALNLTVAGASEEFSGALERIQSVLQRIDADPKRLRLARTTADVLAAGADGAVAVVLNFQNGQPLGQVLGRLNLFRALGVRNIQLTYNERNAIGDGCLEPSSAGLSRFGKEVVRAMNDLGMLIDLSHTGRQTSMEAIALSEAPCVFSHANPKATANNPRNLDDDQIRACAEKGGVIGACAWGPILWTGGEEPPGLPELLRHIEYIAELVGVDHVGVSTDSTSSMRDQHIFEHAAEINAAYPEVTDGFVTRFGGTPLHRYPVPIREFSSVARGLSERGWARADVAKVVGGNFMRVWKQVWGA